MVGIFPADIDFRDMAKCGNKFLQFSFLYLSDIQHVLCVFQQMDGMKLPETIQYEQSIVYQSPFKP